MIQHSMRLYNTKWMMSALFNFSRWWRRTELQIYIVFVHGVMNWLKMETLLMVI